MRRNCAVNSDFGNSLEMPENVGISMFGAIYSCVRAFVWLTVTCVHDAYMRRHAWVRGG